MHTNSIKRYVFPCAGSNMYILTENGKALVIDPNVCENALEHLKAMGTRSITVLLTHEHYDHTSGLVWICTHFESTVICHEQTALSLRSGNNNRPIVVAASNKDKLTAEEIKTIVSSLPQGYRYDVDITFSNEYHLLWEDHNIRMISCPGHSKGSCCIEIDSGIVATGDSLILDTPVITRFPGGSIDEYNKITLPYLNSFSDDVLILPGHGDMFYMKESRRNEKT